MERTGRGEVLFYHLELGGGRAEHGLTLLLADRSGEEYSEVADDSAAIENLPEVQRANSITLLVDGGRLLDMAKRHNIRSEVSMILQSLLDGGAIRSHQPLAVVLTKLDLVLDSPHRARAEADFAGLVDHLEKIFAGRIGQVGRFKVAAYPKTSQCPRGEGIAELLDFWLEETASVLPMKPVAPKYLRAIDRVRPRPD